MGPGSSGVHKNLKPDRRELGLREEGIKHKHKHEGWRWKKNLGIVFINNKTDGRRI